MFLSTFRLPRRHASETRFGGTALTSLMIDPWA